MGMFDEIKRLFWVKKAVAKSAAEKAAEKGSEFGEDLADKASETWDNSKEFAEDLGEKIVTTAKEGYASAKEGVNDLWTKKDDWSPKSPETGDSAAFKAGEKIGATAAKVGDAAEKTWDKAKEEGKELLDKAVKTSDKAWEKTEAVSEDLWNKAKDAAEKAGQKFNEGVDGMLKKAEALDKKIEEETDKVDANRDGWADTTVRDKLKEHESTLKGKDDFFERAARYGEGDYSMGKPVITKPGGGDTEGMTPMPPLPEDDDFDEAIIDDGSEK